MRCDSKMGIVMSRYYFLRWSTGAEAMGQGLEDEGAERELPLHLFPEEIWEMILDRVEDSRDIQNVLIAFPILDEKFHKRKPMWLIDQVLPLLFGGEDAKVHHSSLLNSRLVCKRWSTTVDTFFEDQSKFEALQRRYYNFDRLSKLLDFLTLMDDHQLAKNPFLFGRSVAINSREFIAEGNQSRRFWNETISFLEKFGKHIWKIEIGYPREFDLPIDFWEVLVDALHLIPNVKALKVSAGYYGRGTTQCPNANDEINERDLPHLPHLRVLNLGFYSLRAAATERLLEHYSQQITTLIMDPWVLGNDVVILFPNLKEIIMNNLGWEENVFKIVAPHLTRIKLCSPQNMEPLRPTFFVKKIFTWLGHFPRLERMELGRRNLRWFESETPLPLDYFPVTRTLEYLEIRHNINVLGISGMKTELKFNFLRCLPNVKHLRLLVEVRNEVEAAKMIQECKEHGTFLSFNIWEIVTTKIELVTIVPVQLFSERECGFICVERPRITMSTCNVA